MGSHNCIHSLCKPWAEKLEGYSATDVQTNQLIVEGALLIKGEYESRLIADRLSSRLAPKARAEMAENSENAGGQACRDNLDLLRTKNRYGTDKDPRAA